MKNTSLALVLPLIFAAPMLHAEASVRSYFDAGTLISNLRADVNVAGTGIGARDMTLYGGSVAAGVYFGEGAKWGKGTDFDFYNVGVHQIGIESGLTYGENDHEHVGTGSVKAELLMASELLVYNYNFILPDDIGLIYVGPSVGAVILNTKISAGSSYVQDYSAVFAGGVQIGGKFTVSKNLTVNVGYRLLAMGDFHYGYSAVPWKLETPIAHMFSLGVSYVY